MNRKFDEMTAELTGNPAMPGLVSDHARKTRIVNSLVEARIRKGMTQKAIAKGLGVSVSAVSRLEDMQDADVRLGDIVNYAGTMGVNVSILMEDAKLATTDRIKNCVVMIAHGLQHLTDLAKKSSDDQDIVDGIRKFRSEVLLNFLLRYNASGEGMPRFDFNSGADEDATDESDAMPEAAPALSPCFA